MSNEFLKGLTASKILFVIDAAHAVEESLLRNWLAQEGFDIGASINLSDCVIPIADDPEDIPTENLSRSLNVDQDTLVVPIRVVWKTPLDASNQSEKKPNKPRLADLWRGNIRRPSKRKARKILNENANLAQCIVGQAATLSDLSARYQQRNEVAIISVDLADYVAEQASLALEVAERRLRGSRYKVPRQVSKQVRASDGYKRGLQEIMRQSDESENELRTRAMPYFKELVALPHNFWQDVSGMFNRWVISLGYEKQVEVDVTKLERFRSVVREHPTALLWTHKTHMDGVTIQSVLFENDFPPPHIMGGINMAFAGIGFLARRSGAIFIRRSFQDNPLYKLVLRQYLSFLLEKRFPLTWSFEGTRSRVGKLMPPRYGMLKYVMDAMQESPDQYLHIIPVAINYDMNNDVKDYASEQSGGRKRPESLTWLISYLRRMRQPLGRIYVDFGEPVVVSKNALNEDKLALQKIAFQVGVEANRVTPITLTSLMCLSLLGASPRAQTIDELFENMNAFRQWAKHRNIQFTNDFDDENQSHMFELVETMVSSKLLKCYDEGPQTVYAIGNNQQAMASYYRNTIVHHFVSKAITELALLEAQKSIDEPLTIFWQEADRLRDLFKFEFFYAPAQEFRADIDSVLVFYDKDWQNNISQVDYIKSILSKLTPLVAHASLAPYIEAYGVVADNFARLGGTQTMDEEQSLDLAFKYGRQVYLQRRISSKASIGKMLFSNAYKLFDSYGLVAAEKDKSKSDALAEQRKKMSHELRILSNSLEKIRAMAVPNDIR